MPNGVLQSKISTRTPEQLANLQHFIELGRLSASLLHEISSPLTAAILYLDQVKQNDSENLQQARRSLDVLCNYVEAARQQIHNSPMVSSSFCIKHPINQVKRLVLPLAKARGVSLVIENMPHRQLYGDQIKFQQVIANLVINAIDAYKQASDDLAKPIRLSVACEQQAVFIKVIDWGEGIPPSKLSRIFEPFYTTKDSSQHGLGIGLTIVKEHVTSDFHGSIRVTSSSRNGTQFIVKLPALPCPKPHVNKNS